MGTALLIFIAFCIMLASVATGMASGLWSNALRLINIVTAALLATSLFETVAGLLSRGAASHDLVFDFVAVWMLFVVFLVIFRVATGMASQTRVRFKKPVDVAGGVFFALWTGWVMICFTMATLHTAPLARNSFNGAFQTTPNSKLLGIGPDRMWLAFVHKASLGSFSSMTGGDNEHVFDPNGDFILRYADRRKRAESAKSLRMRKDPHWNAFRRLREGMNMEQVQGLLQEDREEYFAEITSDETTVWTYGPYNQYKHSGGRRFKVRVHFEGDQLTTAYMMWEMNGRESGFFAKDETSAMGE
jgi:uncharacterized membrane protein required for colicin V production